MRCVGVRRWGGGVERWGGGGGGVFFFQAEDGIRDYDVTGVQTCALPIYLLRYVILMAIIAGVVGLIFYFIRENPEKIYLEGKALLDSDPRKAEQLLANSVRANDEDYPQAELLRARALGKMGRWLEALGSFGGIEDFGKCETVRSEERRVGKECRSRGSPAH